MSLKNKFRVDPALTKNGVWIAYSANTDGTIPRFRIARMSKGHNPAYGKRVKELGEVYAPDGEWTVHNEEENERLNLELFVDTVLLEWENVQPEDDGVALAFTRENALKFLGDPEWRDLFDDLRERAMVATTFRHRKQEADLKN